MKTIAIKDFLTRAQQNIAIAIYQKRKRGEIASSDLHRQLLDSVILPNIAEINRKLGQDNDPDYMAYLVEYALVRSGE